MIGTEPQHVKTRKTASFGRATTHDGEVARRDASARVGWLHGGGVRAGKSAWGHPEARRVREGKRVGLNRSTDRDATQGPMLNGLIMAKQRPAFEATDTRNQALAADDDECACVARGESTRGVQRPDLYPVLVCALRQPAWQRPQRASRRGSVRGGEAKGSTLPPKRRARVHRHAGVREGTRVRMPRSRPWQRPEWRQRHGGRDG
jgi:hypothetical protein